MIDENSVTEFLIQLDVCHVV